MSWTSSYAESFLGACLIEPDSFELPLRIQSTDGRRWRLQHYQSCCESVGLKTFNGSWPWGPITEATFEEERGPRDVYGSSTLTTLRLSDGQDTIIIEFLGESNGYYYEDVNLEFWCENENQAHP